MSTGSGDPKVREWELAAMKSLMSDISDMIDCKPMLRLFQQEEIISVQDKNEINRGYPTRTERNDRFLDYCFSNFDAGKISAYQCFVLYCMKNKAYSNMKEQLCCRFDKIKSRNQVPQEPVSPPYDRYVRPVPGFVPGQSLVSSPSPASGSSAGSSLYARDSPGGATSSSWSVMTSPNASGQHLSPVAEFCPGQRTVTPNASSTPIRVTGEGNPPAANATAAAAGGVHAPYASPVTTGAGVPTIVTRPPPTAASGASSSSPQQPSDADTDSIATTAAMTSSFKPSSLTTRHSTATWSSSTSSMSMQGSLVAKETSPSESYTPSTPSSMSSAQVVFPANSYGQPSHCEGRLFQPASTSVSPAMEKTASWVAAHKSHAQAAAAAAAVQEAS